MIAGLLLAAGGSTRFGSQKLLAAFDGSIVVRQSAERLARHVDAMYVVVGCDADRIRHGLRDLSATIVENAEWSHGLSTSVRRGILALSRRTDAVLIALGDQPRLPEGVYDDVVERWRATRAPIVAPVFGPERIRGHPVLFDRSVFAELADLSGDRGARGVVERDGARVEVVHVESATPADIDTPEDLQKLARSG